MASATPTKRASAVTEPSRKKRKRSSENTKEKNNLTSNDVSEWGSYHGWDNTLVYDPKGKGKEREVLVPEKTEEVPVPDKTDEVRNTHEKSREELEAEIMDMIVRQLENMDKEFVECFKNPATSGKVGESSKMGALLYKGWCGSDDGNEVGEDFNMFME